MSIFKTEYECLLLADPNDLDYEQRLSDVESFIVRYSSDPLFAAHHASVLFMKAEALLALKRYPEALPIYQQILDMKPPSIDIVTYQRIGEILLATGREAEAICLLDEAIDKQTALFSKQALLYWYATHVHESVSHIHRFRNEILAIKNESELDVPYTDEDLVGIITYIVEEGKAGFHRGGELWDSIKHLPEDERNKALTEFLAHEKTVQGRNYVSFF